MSELKKLVKNAGIKQYITEADPVAGKQFSDIKWKQREPGVRAAYSDPEVIKLIQLVIDLNLSIPVSIDDRINRKLNAVEKQLKNMNVNPRNRNYKGPNK